MGAESLGENTLNVPGFICPICLTKTKMEITAFCVITYEPIKIQTHSAPQNDRLNFSFVKDLIVVGWKMAKNGCKMAIYELLILIFFSYKTEKTETKQKL